MTNYEIAISVVRKVTSVSRSKILSASRVWPAVEARQLIVLLLSKDGATDETISWGLNRKRGAILKARHNALSALILSKAFKQKYDKCLALYEEGKSLRVSKNSMS